MANRNTSGFWGNHPRLLYGLVVASFMVAIVLGSLTPDIDITWRGHRGWTHNPVVPLGVCLVMAILLILGFARFSGHLKDGFLKWDKYSKQ